MLHRCGTGSWERQSHGHFFLLFLLPWYSHPWVPLPGDISPCCDQVAAAHRFLLSKRTAASSSRAWLQHGVVLWSPSTRVVGIHPSCFVFFLWYSCSILFVRTLFCLRSTALAFARRDNKYTSSPPTRETRRRHMQQLSLQPRTKHSSLIWNSFAFWPCPFPRPTWLPLESMLNGLLRI